MKPLVTQMLMHCKNETLYYFALLNIQFRTKVCDTNFYIIYHRDAAR